jgi:hypothetical protein
MKKHRHRPKGPYDLHAFAGPVSTKQNPAAHGNVRHRDTCACGMQRDTNINQGHIERGPWVGPESEMQVP